MCIQVNICQSALQNQSYLDEFVQSEISKSSNIVEGQVLVHFTHGYGFEEPCKTVAFLAHLATSESYLSFMFVACKPHLLQPLFFSLPNVKEAVSNQMNGKPVQAAFWPHYSKLLCGRGRAVFILFSPSFVTSVLIVKEPWRQLEGRARWY